MVEKKYKMIKVQSCILFLRLQKISYSQPIMFMKVGKSDFKVVFWVDHN